MNTADLKTAQFAAFTARKSATGLVAALSTPQRAAYHAGDRSSDIVSAALDAREKAADLTAAFRATKAAHRAR